MLNECKRSDGARPREMDAQAGSPDWPAPQFASVTLALRKRPLKHAKTDLQAVVMRHFYAEFSAAAEKAAMVRELAALTDLTERQVQKWMWDEELRRRQLSAAERAQLVADSRANYLALLAFFERECPLRSLYVMRTLYLPAAADGAADAAARAAAKLRALSLETVVFLRDRAPRGG